MTDHALLVRPVFRPRHAHQRAHPVKMHISLLDGVFLRVGDREVVLNSCKARALIGYLVLAPNMKETRGRLVGLLWSEIEEEKARASLRQLLHLLREVFDAAGVVGLSADKERVWLDESVIVTDLHRLLASIDQGEAAELLDNEASITDTLLRGYDDLDPSFGSWLTIKREGIRRMLIRKLEVQLCELSHRAETIKNISRALFQIDPTHEVACQKLMSACVALGNAGSALAAYKQLWECLEHEYGLEPSIATQELVVAIKRGELAPSSAISGEERT